MFMHALTPSTFQKAINNFLKDNQFRSVKDTHLFAAIERAANLDNTLPAHLNAATILSTWTNQAGYPIVTVQRSYTNAQSVTLYQARYFRERPPKSLRPKSALWWIPYNWATASWANFRQTSATNWLGTDMAIINITELKRNDWLLLNKRQTGFYRVLYDAENYRLLANALFVDHSLIDAVSRAQLLNDAFELAYDGLHSYTFALELAKYLRFERNNIPWTAALRGFGHMERLIADSPFHEAFRSYALWLTEDVYPSISWFQDGPDFDISDAFQEQIIRWACEHGNSECLRFTHLSLDLFLMQSLVVVQPHLRNLVMCQGMRSATNEQFFELLNRLHLQQDEQVRNDFIDAIACASSALQLKELVDSSTKMNFVASWNATQRYRIFQRVVRNRLGWQVATVFLRQNFDDAALQYGAANVNAAIGEVAEFVTSNERFRVVSMFCSLFNSFFKYFCFSTTN